MGIGGSSGRCHRRRSDILVRIGRQAAAGAIVVQDDVATGNVNRDVMSRVTRQ